MPGNVFDLGLRAIRSPKSIFLASCISSIACISITVPLTWAYSMRGAVTSIVLSSAILLTAITILFRRKSRVVIDEKEIVPLTLQPE
jgi:O-antigen/teichoic acid export membrane protein